MGHHGLFLTTDYNLWFLEQSLTLGRCSYFLSGTFLVVRPVHSHRHTRAARVRKSANMVSANMVSVGLSEYACHMRQN